MSTELKNLQATAHNLLCRFDALKGSGECIGWGGDKWAKFCAKVEDLRAAVTAAEKEEANAAAATKRVEAMSAGPMWDY